MIQIGAVCFAVLAAVFTPSLALAHPCLCHADSLAAGFAHPLSGVDHLLAMIGVGLWAAQLSGRAIWTLPLGFMSALVVGGILGIIGAPVPLVEPGILGSLVTIGLAIALAWRVHAAAGFALVAAFALLHGYAHGAEMPQSASALSYALGFLVATGLLHLTGIGMGLLARHLRQPLLIRGAGAAISAVGMILVFT
ncbi:MAG TPA: HupE/UreJ family protein [Pseudolabrys sp.]|jgi:urease accessory protein|nr:HupE/UreJ family protein [Pseudolabrys sp.]